MEIKRKCSSKEHKDVNAIKFCAECKIYMCNKCENFHSFLFYNHNTLIYILTPSYKFRVKLFNL